MKLTTAILYCCLGGVWAYWDIGTTTSHPGWWRWDQWVARTSRFRWQRSEHHWWRMLYPWWNWHELEWRRKLYVIAGVSYQMINLGVAAILNRRTLITGANLLDPYMHDAQMVRVWALGRQGRHNTPWRYRVWRLTRINPRSSNPEHCHGAYCYHTPRHDVCIIHTKDQMYVHYNISPKYHYPARTYICHKNQNLMADHLYFAGSGYEYHEHIAENYKIFYTTTSVSQVRDCSLYLPKWWGKFICFNNHLRLPGVQNGMPLFSSLAIVGLGCFQHTYNEVSYLVFTDIRYYVWWIYNMGYVRPGEYYEYAYPEWGVTLWNLLFWEDFIKDEVAIPTVQVRDDMFPLG